MNPIPPDIPITDNELVYTIKEVADKLKVSPWTVNKLINDRQLHSIHIGARHLVPATDLEEYLRELRKGEKGVRHGF